MKPDAAVPEAHDAHGAGLGVRAGAGGGAELEDDSPVGSHMRGTEVSQSLPGSSNPARACVFCRGFAEAQGRFFKERVLETTSRQTCAAKETHRLLHLPS